MGRGVMSEKKFELSPKDGAIVFRGEGVEFYYPTHGSMELQETFEYITFALMKQEWMEEWYEYLDAAEALADLAGEPESESKVPNLRVIKGGKSDEE